MLTVLFSHDLSLSDVVLLFNAPLLSMLSYTIYDRDSKFLEFGYSSHIFAFLDLTTRTKSATCPLFMCCVKPDNAATEVT